MQAAVERVDLEYEAAFFGSGFDLSARNMEVLRSFHEGIGSSYPIRSSDMQISRGDRLSEVRVRISLFGGNGLIDVTEDRLSISFEYM